MNWSYISPFIERFLDGIRETKAHYRLHLKSLPHGGTFFHLSTCIPFPLPIPAMSFAHRVYWQNLSKKNKTQIPQPLHAVKQISLRLTAPIKFWLNGSDNNYKNSNPTLNDYNVSNTTFDVFNNTN